MKRNPSSCANVAVEPLDLSTPVDAAVVSFARATGSAILESSLQATDYGRFSVLARDPVDEFTRRDPGASCPFRGLAHRMASYPPVADPGIDLPFVGGWIGFITYEAGLGIERIGPGAPGDVDLPMVRFRLYDSAAIYDHVAERWYTVAVDWPGAIARRRPSVAHRLASLRDRLATAEALDLSDPASELTCSDPVPNMSREAYFEKVARAKRYIEAGDIYQVNLTQRWTVRTDISPLELYLRLRRESPSSHAALLPWGSYAILSSSPELFLDLRGGHVVTRPIKGTRPRIGDPVMDSASRRELSESEKERAELTMIIDLLRNDLGRVCSFGSVRVREAGALEEHPTVFHRVATIEGDLEPGRTRLDLLLATFPGGSVTGAPKIRAMQIISELEPTARGVYCGSIGMIGLDGSMSMNIAIRTMVRQGNVAYVHAGGAIVADSTPQQEYDETLAKAAGMFRALRADPEKCGTGLQTVHLTG